MSGAVCRDGGCFVADPGLKFEFRVRSCFHFNPSLADRFVSMPLLRDPRPTGLFPDHARWHDKTARSLFRGRRSRAWRLYHKRNSTLDGVGVGIGGSD